MNTPFDRISAFVLERAPELPLHQRAQLYRDMAELTTDEARASQLASLARDCTAIDARSGQLLLNLRAPRAAA